MLGAETTRRISYDSSGSHAQGLCARRDYLGIRFFSGNLGFLWGSYFFNHFFRDLILEKEVFKFLNQFAHFNHQFKLLIHYTMHAMTFWILLSKPWHLDSRLGGCRRRVINGFSSNLFGS
jgi:hypothetical protein